MPHLEQARRQIEAKDRDVVETATEQLCPQAALVPAEVGVSLQNKHRHGGMGVAVPDQALVLQHHERLHVLL